MTLSTPRPRFGVRLVGGSASRPQRFQIYEIASGDICFELHRHEPVRILAEGASGLLTINAFRIESEACVVEAWPQDQACADIINALPRRGTITVQAAGAEQQFWFDEPGFTGDLVPWPVSNYSCDGWVRR